MLGRRAGANRRGTGVLFTRSKKARLTLRLAANLRQTLDVIVIMSRSGKLVLIFTAVGIGLVKRVLRQDNRIIIIAPSAQVQSQARAPQAAMRIGLSGISPDPLLCVCLYLAHLLPR
jgi:hypothetical protein